MNLHTKLSLGTLLLLSVIAVACGGATGSSFASPTTPSPTLTPAPGSNDPYAGPIPTPTPAPVAADMTIGIVGMDGNRSYSPNPATVRVGQTVAWNNGDSVAHTATADGGSFDTGFLAPGATSNPIVMAAAGSFPYHCQLHGFTMVGTLTVTQ
jgi:plastocyanin